MRCMALSKPLRHGLNVFTCYCFNLVFIFPKLTTLFFLSLRLVTLSTYLSMWIDVLITGSSPTQVHQFVHQLQASLSLKDLGNPSYFLGLELNKTPQGVLLSQQNTSLKSFTKLVWMELSQHLLLWLPAFPS